MKINTEEIKRFFKKNLKWIIIFFCIIYFIEITGDVYQKDIMRKDIYGYKIISNFISSKSSSIPGGKPSILTPMALPCDSPNMDNFILLPHIELIYIPS